MRRNREIAHIQTVETALQLVQHVEKDTFRDILAGEMNGNILLMLKMIKKENRFDCRFAGVQW